MKAKMGHAEPAAGMAGLVEIIGSLRNSFFTGLSHVGRLNSFVVSSLDRYNTLQFQLSRQSYQMPSQYSSGDAKVGMSGFAFMGTNAHLILSPMAAASKSASSDVTTETLWEHTSLWPLPDVFGLMGFLECDSDSAVFSCNVDKATLSYLYDHRVQGRSLLPGSAFVELACETTHTAVKGEARYGIENLVLHAPLVLDSASDITSTSILTLKQYLASTAFTIQSVDIMTEKKAAR